MSSSDDTPILYRIKDWATHFDSKEARKIKNLNWVQMPINHDGLTFRRMARRPDAFSLFGAWCLLVEVAAKNPMRQRGLLASRGEPLTPEDLCIKTGFPEEGFAAAFAYFSDPKVGWLEIVNPAEAGESPDTAGRHPDEEENSPSASPESPASTGAHPPTDRHDRQEKTGQERETRTPSLPPDSIRRETDRLPTVLATQDFGAVWEKWLGYLSRQPGRKDFLTIDGHVAKLADIAKRKGVSAAVDAIEYAILAGLKHPVEDTRPASERASTRPTPAPARNEAAARDAAGSAPKSAGAVWAEFEIEGAPEPSTPRRPLKTPETTAPDSGAPPSGSDPG